MKIGVAQSRPVIGNVEANITNHKALIELAASNGAALAIFPELSLSGYEPRIASQVATTVDDPRFSDLQKLSDKHNISIGAGIPVKHEKGITITMIIFQPHQSRRSYSKKYLHSDEEPFFISGENFSVLTIGTTKISLAICYEISVPEHAAAAGATRPAVYIASVAKYKRHMDNTIATLSNTARQNNMWVMMSNCLGICDGEECCGTSLVINNEGSLVEQLDDTREGVLVLDLETKMIVKKYI